MGKQSFSWMLSGQYSDIFYHKMPGIAKLTINRPEVLNAFRPKTIVELMHAFSDACADRDIGVIILTGVGTRAFCSGGDQKIRGDDGYKDESGDTHLNVLEFQRLIRFCHKPVIAMVAGYAIGGGHILHMICDLTVAADNAIFGQTGPKVGSFDGGYGSSYMARIVGQKKAREIWFLCKQYSASEALQMGLVNKVVELDHLEQATIEMCKQILEHSPIALRCLKAALNADCDGQAGIQQLAGDATMLFYMSKEAQEGRNAFNEKRKPSFRSPVIQRPQLLHNPACSKSNQALKLLQKSEISHECVFYLESGISSQILHRILDYHHSNIHNLIRIEDVKKDNISLPSFDYESVFNWLKTHYKYLQRPILLTDSHAIIARPAELILQYV